MYRLSYYPWLTQNVPDAEIRRQIEIFGVEISDQLAKLGQTKRVKVIDPVDVPEQIEQVVSAQAEIALMNPLGFVFAAVRSARVQAVAVALRIIDGKEGNVYFAQLYTHKDSGIKTLAQARGKSIGYGVAYSTSNFLVPAHLLQKAGVHPLLGFSRVEFLKGHEVVARAVYDRKVDVGAGHDGVIIDLGNQPGYSDAGQVLVQLERSPPIPSDPIAVTIEDTAERKALQTAIVAAGNTEKGKAALKIFWGNTQGLAETNNDFYSTLSNALTALKLTEKDLMP